MDTVKMRLTVASATSANRRRRLARLLCIPMMVLFAGGLFGVTQRVARAYSRGDASPGQLRLGYSSISNTTDKPTPPDELTVGENFAGQTKDHEYRFRLDGSRDALHLHVSAVLSGGKIEWELIDPTGRVRTHIGITEHGDMDATDMKTIKGEWLLRIKLEDATGKYDIHWTQ